MSCIVYTRNKLHVELEYSIRMQILDTIPLNVLHKYIGSIEEFVVINDEQSKKFLIELSLKTIHGEESLIFDVCSVSVSSTSDCVASLCSFWDKGSLMFYLTGLDGFYEEYVTEFNADDVCRLEFWCSIPLKTITATMDSFATITPSIPPLENSVVARTLSAALCCKEELREILQLALRMAGFEKVYYFTNTLDCFEAIVGFIDAAFLQNEITSIDIVNMFRQCEHSFYEQNKKYIRSLLFLLVEKEFDRSILFEEDCYDGIVSIPVDQDSLKETVNEIMKST